MELNWLSWSVRDYMKTSLKIICHLLCLLALVIFLHQTKAVSFAGYEENPNDYGDHVAILSQNIVMRLAWDVDPWNQYEYSKIINDKIAHAAGSKHPGEEGSVYLFSHSSNNTDKFPFSKIQYLTSGDLIQIYKNGALYEYKVFETLVVEPSEIELLKNSEGSGIGRQILVMQTCFTKNPKLRFLVKASRVYN